MDVSHPMKGNEICKSVYLSVSKKPQKILEATGAIFVITQEDSNFLSIIKSISYVSLKGGIKMYHVKHPELQRLISCSIFRITISTVLVTIMLLCSMTGSSKAATIEPTDLTELSLEELMNIEITSVSKKPERLADAAAAIFVITQEDIRRSGVTSIPEALRMAPGINVARIDSNKWAITSRGLDSTVALPTSFWCSLMAAASMPLPFQAFTGRCRIRSWKT